MFWDATFSWRVKELCDEGELMNVCITFTTVSRVSDARSSRLTISPGWTAWVVDRCTVECKCISAEILEGRLSCVGDIPVAQDDYVLLAVARLCGSGFYPRRAESDP